MSSFQYAYFRTDKPKDPGFSHELISVDWEPWCEQNGGSVDELDVVPFPGVDTVNKLFYRIAEKMPNHDFLGTRVGNTYKWITFREALETSRAVGRALKENRLAPDMKDEDGKTWNCIGVMSKTRKEWALMQYGNMFQNITTVGFYDSLSMEAVAAMINETELTTMACSKEVIKKLSNFKLED